MTRRTIPEEDIRNILKVRRSYYVSLPIQIVREFGWREGQKVVVEKRGKEIVIKDWPLQPFNGLRVAPSRVERRQAQGKKK